MTYENVIDTDDYLKSGIETFKFPGGEWHANVPKWSERSVHVFAKLREWDDVGQLMVVCDALRSQQVDVYLFAPYLPGARQDRNPDGLTPLTVALYNNGLSWVRQDLALVRANVRAEVAKARGK